MTTEQHIPEDPLDFIQKCVLARSVFWTYHVTMRMEGRFISRQMIFKSTQNYRIMEAYRDDKYLPSYLVWSKFQGKIFHVLFAVDVKGKNVRIVTAYYPNSEEWIDNFSKRRK